MLSRFIVVCGVLIGCSGGEPEGPKVLEALVPADMIAVIHSSGTESAISDKAELDKIKLAIGPGPLSDNVPKCMPQVRLLFFKGEEELGSAGFCDATLAAKTARIDVGDTFGAVEVKDVEPLKVFFKEPELSMAPMMKADKIKSLTAAGEKLIVDKAEVDKIRTALGTGPLSEKVPSCTPQARMMFYEKDKDVAVVSFCDTTMEAAAVRVDVGGKSGSLTVKDPGPLKVVLGD
ncbi:MAG: hypothetical protein HN348_16285 [Proteobacteria bacterium]|nr:hypothetical protein [Pseudomonadota bacterium]